MSYTSRMPDNPLRRMLAITPSDSTEYLPPIVLLRVGVAGNLTVQDLEGNSIVISNVAAGEYVPGPFRRIMAATTATSLVGWRNE